MAKFVLATVAPGIRLHVPAVRRIIHFKSPTNISKYIQETRRAGGDRKPASANIYYYKTDGRNNRTGLQNAIKQKGICLKAQLLPHLDFTPELQLSKCKCCSAYKQVCKCSEYDKFFECIIGTIKVHSKILYRSSNSLVEFSWA